MFDGFLAQNAAAKKVNIQFLITIFGQANLIPFVSRGRVIRA